MSIRAFVDEHYRHFNAGTVARASASLVDHLAEGGRIFLTLAGAMSTAEIGRTLADMIRAGHIAAISCTGANLEEDVFNLIARDAYLKVPNHEDLAPADEVDLFERQLNRVTDVCIPEEAAIRAIEHRLMGVWRTAQETGESLLPHEHLYRLLRSGALEDSHQADPMHSWVLAAAEANLPIYVPGWEDSTLGNIFAARCSEGHLHPNVVLSGTHYMTDLMRFYRSCSSPLAFLQAGGGIAGDFAISVVPMLRQDAGIDVNLWSWYAQISESRPSFGGYSGAPPNEKISWDKLDIDSPRFVIESDATIVLPLLLCSLE